MSPSLRSEKIRLRALEKTDVELLYRWENDTEIWGVSETLLPFSRHILERFIEEQTKDIFETRQYRLVIETREERPVGVVDLFSFDPVNLRAGVGILIHDPADRGKGYAREAIHTVAGYAGKFLRLHQLYCEIPQANRASEALFRSCGFVRTGTKKQWIRSREGWEDVFFFQRFL